MSILTSTGDIDWKDISQLMSVSFTCGYCNRNIASDIGYYATIYPPAGAKKSFNFGSIHICHHCGKPTFIDLLSGRIYPGASYGNPVSHIEHSEVNTLYDEARACMSVNAYTSAVICCRKLIMNIAVSEDADEGKSFVYYVNYLADGNHIPKRAKDMLDAIRNLGNEANHEIHTKSEKEAELAIKFVEMLLKFMYEFPVDVKSLVPDGTEEDPTV